MLVKGGGDGRRGGGTGGSREEARGGGVGSADEWTQLIKNILLQNICTALDLLLQYWIPLISLVLFTKINKLRN